MGRYATSPGEVGNNTSPMGKVPVFHEYLFNAIPFLLCTSLSLDSVLARIGPVALGSLMEEAEYVGGGGERGRPSGGE